MKRLSLLAVMAFALAACGETAAPTEMELPTALAKGGNAPVLNARGSGLIGSPSPNRAFTFNVRKNADGEVKGTFNLSRNGGEADVHLRGDVTCATTDGAGRIWVGGVITKEDVWPEGARVAFTAIDGGRDDLISFLAWAPDFEGQYDQAVCDFQPDDFFMNEVVRGNLTVTE